MIIDATARLSEMAKRQAFRVSLLIVASVTATVPAGESIVPDDEKYHCAPCGCASDGKAFDAAGDCPSCHMPLVVTVETSIDTSDISEQTEADALASFAYDESVMPVGKVFFYQKSNIDGTHSSPVTMYVPAADRIESLKWSPGSGRSTLVKATMDWGTYSVRHFDTFLVYAGDRRERSALLDVNAATRQLEFAFDGNSWESPIVMFPWHTYDFDFASLAMAMRHLVDPEAPFQVALVEQIVVNGKQDFGFKGTIDVRYEADEERAGRTCRRYSVDGAGIENKGGFMWFDKAERHLIDYEINHPDENGYKDGKLLLQKVETFSREQWEAFIKASVESGD